MYKGDLLITGGAGFIGTNLIVRLRELGYSKSIRVLDNERSGCRENLSGLDVDFRFGDIRDRVCVLEALSGIDQVIHLAADTTVAGSIENPVCNYQHNVLGTLNVLEGMRQTGVINLINASTGGAITGDTEQPVHEGLPPRPLSPYGASKLAAEGYCSSYAASYGLRTISLRFSNVYGPHSAHKKSVVAAFMKALRTGASPVVYGDGQQTRDFVFARDLADGIILALGHHTSGTFQLGAGTPTSLVELLEIAQQLCGYRPALTHRRAKRGEVRHTYCDISRAQKELGYCPETSLLEGCAETWNWFSGQPA